MSRFLIGLTLVWATACLPQSSVAQDETSNTEKSPAIQRPDLRDEILQMAKEDQMARQALIEAMNAARPSPTQTGEGKAADNSATEGESTPKSIVLTGPMQQAMQRVTAIDKRTRTRMSAVVDELGWPGKSLVGEEASHAAWLLVQHADADPEFQKKCLDLMKKAPPGEVSGKDIAYLTDRTLINSGQPQVYGTQLNEKFEPSPMSDPDHVDKRRAEVGLGPLKEYIEKTREAYLNPGK